MSHFVLIHGALHGGWCWEHLVPLLDEHGHTVEAPDLPGLGASQLPPSEVTLECWGNFVAEILRKNSERTILVGHSMGGLAISQAAEYAPERIAALVYLAAILLKDGHSASDMARGKSQLELTASPNGQTVTAEPDSARIAFYADSPAEWREQAVARLVPQPTGIFTMPLHLTAARYGSVKRAYITCLRDQALTPAVQRAMQTELPCDFSAEIDTDHSPFLSAPDTLASILLDIASQFA